MRHRLGIEGGEVVTPAGRRQANVYVDEGRIAAVGSDRHGADEVVDASGLLVLPGMVDAHVHLMDPADTSREDFPTGTAAALRSGVTTLIEHTHARPVVGAADLEEKRRYLAGRSRTDFGLAAHAWPDRLDEVADVWASGAAFVKAFTCTTHGVPGFDSDRLRSLFDVASRCGAVCLLHCEDEELTREAEHELREAGRDDGGVIPAWRNPRAERTALQTACAAAAAAEVRAVAAHVSSLEALAAADGLVAETCPQYLTLLEDEVLVEGPLRKFTPPARARSQAELDDMWRAVADGRIDYVASDHAPSTLAQKRGGSIWDVHFGLPGLDTTLAVLLDAAAAGRLSYERVTEVYSQRPAQLYGLWPRKGDLRVGTDGDIVLVDPHERWLVRDEDVTSKAGWSPFAGRALVGRAVRTYLRGELVVESGRVVGEPGVGRFLPGPGADQRI